MNVEFRTIVTYCKKYGTKNKKDNLVWFILYFIF